MANSTVCQSKWKPIAEPRRAKPKTYRQAPTHWLKFFWRGRHWVWGPNRRRAIKEWSIAINNDWVNPVWGTPRDIAIKKREIGHIKIKIVPFMILFVETVPLEIHRFKSKKGVLVSEELALFNWSSVGYMRSAIR